MVPKRLCGLRNQSTSTPSSATRFITPLAPMMEVFTAPERISTPTTTTKIWKPSRSSGGPGQVHGEAAEQVVDVLAAHRVGNDHDREQRDHAGAEHRVDAHDVAGVRAGSSSSG